MHLAFPASNWVECNTRTYGTVPVYIDIYDAINPSCVLFFIHDYLHHPPINGSDETAPPQSYAAMIDFFASQNCIVLTPHLIGHGLSDGSQGSLSVDDNIIAFPQLLEYASTVLPIIRTLPLIVIGHGFGALCAYRWQHGKQIICINPTFQYSSMALKYQYYIDLKHLEGLLPVADLICRTIASDLDTCQPPFDKRMFVSSIETYQLLLDDPYTPLYASRKSFLNVAKNQWEAECQISCRPTLFIASEEDELTDLSATRIIARSEPTYVGFDMLKAVIADTIAGTESRQFLVITGAGHNIQYEDW